MSDNVLILNFSELWRKETQMTQTLSSHKEELAKADQALRSMAGRVSSNYQFVGGICLTKIS